MDPSPDRPLRPRTGEDDAPDPSGGPVRPDAGGAGGAEEVLNSLADGLIVVGRDGAILRMNPAAERISGCSEARYAGSAVADVFPDRPEVGAVVDRCLGSGGSTADRSITVAGPDGRPVSLEVLASPWWDASGSLRGAVLQIRDRTPVRVLEEDTRRGQRLVMAEALGAGLAHEVRNPLGGIRGAAQLLARRAGARPGLSECVDVILRETERLDGLVGSVLELAKVGDTPADLINVHRLLDETLDVLGLDPGSEGIHFQTSFDPSLPEVRGDADALVRVFHNLLRNAIEAIEDEGTIRVATSFAKDFSRIWRASGRSRFLKVEVLDDGPGIPPDVRDRIFTPLFTTKPRGTGLGLCTALKVVEDHGGFLRVLERVPRGTRFEVYLPLPTGDEATGDEATVDGPGAAPGAADRS